MYRPSSFRSFRPPAPRGEGREAQTADAGSTRFRLVSHMVLGAGAPPRRGRSPGPVPRIRSEARRVGEGCGRTCRSRWSQYHEHQIKTKYSTTMVEYTNTTPKQ